jgi:hypothetical protein
MQGHCNLVVHPFTLAPRGHHTRTTQVREMPLNLRLALLEYLDEIAATNLPPVQESRRRVRSESAANSNAKS